MTTKRLIAITFIFICTGFAWSILGGALDQRSRQASASAAGGVAGAWGPPLTQTQPTAWYQSPGSPGGQAVIRPASSRIDVGLTWEPKRKGLVWFRTYGLHFAGTYEFANPTPIPQTVYIQFRLPSAEASYNSFSFLLDGKPTTANVSGGEPIMEALTLAPGQTAVLQVGYRTRGVDSWNYSFGEDTRVQKFQLAMVTDFEEIDFPAATSSPTQRNQEGGGWNLIWDYQDEIGARGIGMAMPNVLNPGPTASRITFFAPVSLLFFFAVLVVLCMVQRVDLHPMNFFFLGAGCFAFQLLFAYLVDLVPIGVAFSLGAIVSLVLVSGYLFLAFGRRFATLAAVAQFTYMVLFSYSFFFDGLTGLTITIGAILTLAILMITTARIKWSERFARQDKPPTIPVGSVGAI